VSFIEKIENFVFGEREIKYVVQNIEDPTTKNNLVHTLQKTWLDELSQKDTSFSMLCIFGEFKCLKSIAQVLDNEKYEKLCNKIEVVFGEILYSQESKNELTKLLSKHQEKFFVYQKKTRPEHHKILIENKLMVEDDHSFEGKYEYVMVLENISKAKKNNFLNELREIKNGTTRITMNNIEKVKVAHPEIV